MTIPYTENPPWADGSGGGTPINAAKLNKIEQGITDAHSMPCARVYHTAAVNLVTATVGTIPFNSERYDTDTIHDTATNNTRLTCKTAGVYFISGTLAYNDSADTGGTRKLGIRLNGTTELASDTRSYASLSETQITVATDYKLAVNDYVELIVYQTSGATKGIIISGNYSPEFMMHRAASG